MSRFGEEEQHTLPAQRLPPHACQQQTQGITQTNKQVKRWTFLHVNKGVGIPSEFILRSPSSFHFSICTHIYCNYSNLGRWRTGGKGVARRVYFSSWANNVILDEENNCLFNVCEGFHTEKLQYG